MGTGGDDTAEHGGFACAVESKEDCEFGATWLGISRWRGLEYVEHWIRDLRVLDFVLFRA